MHAVKLPDGTHVPALGQGTWRLGENIRPRRDEVDALRLGIDLGMTLLDTAEMYADGGAEEVVAEAIASQREQTFVVSKVYPHNASRAGTIAACERSLRRLRTDVIDLYLLHWRGSVPLAETVAAFEALRDSGKIRHWGVSNFDVSDMEELFRASGGKNCAANQVLWNAETRGIEFDLIPWSAEHDVPIMAYSPVGQAGRLLRSKGLKSVAARHGVTPAQVAIAWTLRLTGVISIPKAGTPAHVRENAAAGEITLTEADLADIDAAHPAPRGKKSLAML